MAKKKERPFDKLYAELEDIRDARGNLINTVLFSKNGNWSVILEIENPIQQYSTDATLYYAYTDILNNIIQTLGEGYCIQKQDVFCKQGYNYEINDDMNFLYKSYFKYFRGREYTNIRTFLIITQEFKQSSFIKYDPKAWLDFHSKVSKVINILAEKNISSHKLNKKEVAEYVHRFLAFDFKPQPFSMNNMTVTDEYIKTGGRAIKSFSIVNIDTIDLPSYILPFKTLPVNGFSIATDLLSFLADIPSTDCVVYNQVIQVPHQRSLMRKLQSKAKRHDSMPDPSNRIAKADIDHVLDLLAKESKLLVYCNFNIIASCPLTKVNEVGSFIETKLYDCGIMPSKACYNQLELFSNSFPGMSYSFNKDYDLFLTLGDAALCLFYKEHMKHSEESRLNVFYTDRQGIPVSIDITGKEGKIKMTDNANFFCLGPSGSGKSFHMNSVVAQLLMQDTDVIMIDTGDSYEGISHYFQGTYITYSKDKPISMNPFCITSDEYNLNFGEKKQFLKSLIFLIFKGNEEPTKIEDKIINQTLVEYYDEYYHPFEKFSERERERLRERLLLEEKKNGEYERYEEKLEEKYGGDYTISELEGISSDDIVDSSDKIKESKETDDLEFTDEEKEHHAKIERQVNKLRNIVNDKAATDGEKQNANRQLIRLMPELIEGKYLMRIEKKIDKMEKKRRKLRVSNLSFNTYYEFALERIPQIMTEKKIEFDIDNFAAILEQFYKGGELEYTLNNEFDSSLFDEKFIVFEIDKIKDDPILFPIVVLIIMDVFLQKMRLKKGRKALIIEEAWKAISSPTMAGYIKYLYKTVRKFNGIAGVVTQELNDVIDSPIVKEAIINNSDVKILLDQSKFKDRYEDISSILGLTEVQKQQIFTVNALPSKEGIPYHKEVWISRGQNSDVYSVEVPPEWYWAFTTERVEKEALKIYERAYNNNIEQAIAHIEEDRKRINLSRYFDFAVLINKHQNIMDLWDK
jgi:conjugation system ATPase, TraG family